MNIELMPYEDFKETETIKYGTAATSASANQAPLFIKEELNRLYNYVKMKFSENPLEWDSRKTYSVGDVAAHGGTIYIAIADNGNQEPPSVGWEVYDTSALDMDLKYVSIDDDNYIGLIDRNSYSSMNVQGDNTTAIMTSKNGLIPWDNGSSSTLGTSTYKFNDIYSVNAHINTGTIDKITGCTNATISSISSTTVTADNFIGVASSAKYADIAEKYVSDADYVPGTVLAIGGDEEVTIFKSGMKLAGVISTQPGYMLNSEADGVFVALKGRVPVRIYGSAKKGQYIIASDNGKGIAVDDYTFEESKLILGIAISDGEDTVEIKV